MEEDLRHEFKGVLEIDPITGMKSYQFGGLRRLPLYIQSFIFTLPFFGVVLAIMIAFLNVTGIVNPNSHGGLFYI